MSGGLIRAAGGVVFCDGPDGDQLLLLIRDKYGVWTLPKGHLEAGEDEQDAAVREIAEETGIDCDLGDLLHRMVYPVFKRGAWRDKQVAYFLARADHATPTPRLDEGIVEACWLPPKEALARLSYAQVRDVVRRALARVGREG
ncbi:NUDIX hydrolase [Oscillochloris sp. ZM17-4]|uniref:NUDIX hydrolase n=1 Tax=Oscillochloris sp. ZM17-4 TaxID=2866714 RepID=UPI001C72B6E8|nr:NUDIX hydrolase [Oscillochloris sp. ZM17-4]